MRLRTWCVVVALLTACSTSNQTRPSTPASASATASPTPPPSSAPPSDSAGWVNTLLSTLTLEEKVGQMLMGRIDGDFDNVGAAQMRTAISQITTFGMGGFAVGIGSPADFALKLNELQRRSKLPLWFAADLEWGSGMRLWRPTWLPYGSQGGGGTAFPFNMGIGATGDPRYAEMAGRITGREARAVGVQWVLAPVADVNTALNNPIVNVRSYGSDPKEVARFVSAFVKGVNASHALSSAKHFPGHGDTEVDSHIDLPVLQVTRVRLDSLELVPFRAAISAGVSSVMTGHLAVPALGSDRETPASVAAQTGTLIRGELGFNGLIITDALTMGALRRLPGYSPAELAIRAVEAGTDVLLSVPDVAQAHAGVVAAVRAGRLSAERIDESVRRILGAKAWLGLQRNRLVDLDSVNRIVASVEHERMAAEMAARSITLARDSASVLPLDPRRMRRVTVVAVSAVNDISAGRTLAAQLRRSYSTVDFTRLDESLDQKLFDEVVEQASRSDAVIFATFLMPISGQGHIRVPARASELADRIAALRKPTITVAFGDPYGPSYLSTASSYLLAWQPRGDHAQVAAGRAIAGLAAITGKLPIELPRSAATRASERGLTRQPANYRLTLASAEAVGMSALGLARVDSIIEAAISDRASPGIALAIGRHGRLVRLQGYGKLDYRPGFGAVTDSALYDLASLTKVVGTTSAAMLLVQEGLLDLNAPVKRYLPEWTGTPVKEAVTVRQLMMHTAGLPSGLPLWRTARGKAEFLAGIVPVELNYEPGTRMVYSDLGLMLTGFIVERLSGQPLDELLQRRVFGPLGLRETLFNPLLQSIATASGGSGALPARSQPAADEASPLFPRIAPTEIDTLFRKQHMHGRVHDENAFAAGGVVGHAGLFSSARDLAAFSQMLLDRGFYGGERIFAAETVDSLRRRQNDYSSRALGWDTPAACGNGTAAGDYFSAESIGHTGFTGTSIWIDFERDLFVVLLTNRVNPTRNNQKQAPLRRAVHDAAEQAITDMQVSPREWTRQRPAC